jgi:alanine racemase
MTTTIPALAERAWVDVDLAALVANARTVQARAGTRLLPMVKANGYGLGAVAVARALQPLRPWGFGVATPWEGAQLRSGGVAGPIVVFAPLCPAWIPHYLEHHLTPSIGDVQALATWLPLGRAFHLEIDTGMGRAGIRWDDAPQLREAAALLGTATQWEGLFTHFHSADTDPLATHAQWTRFQDAIASLPPRPPFVHAANSAAALRGTEYALDLVRPGIFLYGGSAGPDTPRPVARLSASVVATRAICAGESVSYGATWRASQDTRVATLGIGYADGMPRSLSSRGFVELHGERCLVVGRVTMDMTVIEVGARPVQVGDVAVVYGGLVSLDEQARAADTVSYELLTRIGRRIPRHHHGAEP